MLQVIKAVLKDKGDTTEVLAPLCSSAFCCR